MKLNEMNWRVKNNFVYELNDRGSNRWSALVQGIGLECTNEELDQIALLMSFAPNLLQCLKFMREEYARLPHSLGYSFTHLPEIDELLAKIEKALSKPEIEVSANSIPVENVIGTHRLANGRVYQVVDSGAPYIPGEYPKGGLHIFALEGEKESSLTIHPMLNAQ